MGSKGSATTTTNQQQTYTPTGAGYIQNALDRAGQAANLPFNIPQAPVAGFSQDQQTAFGNINAAQGMAQPYINQAAGYFSPQGAQQFLNPYAANVMANLQDVFGQQQSQATGQLTQAAGGVGADRIAVGQSELAKQQGLAAGQTLSGLYNNAVQQAQSAGYGTAALGSQAQNAALSGAQAQLASGGLQQQLAQAQLNSPYQQQLLQAQFPYQQAQFLAGITGSLAPGLGGTTQGSGTTTTPAPSIWSQILGLGTAGVGAAGGMGAFGGGKGGSAAWGGGSPTSGDAYGGSGANPLPGLSPSDYGFGYAEGGAAGDAPIDVSAHPFIPTQQIAPIQPHIPQLNLNPPQQQQGGGGGGVNPADIMKFAMAFLKRGGSVNPYAFADGGDTDEPGLGERVARYMSEGRDAPRRALYNATRAGLLNNSTAPEHGSTYGGLGLDLSTRRSLQMHDAQDIQRAVRGYADGGDTDVVNPGDPIRLPDQEAVDAWRQGVDADRAAGVTATAFTGPDTTAAFPPPPGVHARSGSQPLSQPRPEAGADEGADAGADAGASSASGAGDSAAPSRGGFAASPWAALMAAGLGMAAGTSPFAGVNIGQGGLQGLKTLEAQRAASQKDETIAQAARRLEQEAKFHEDQFTRETMAQKNAREQAHLPYEQMTAAQKESAVIARKREELAEKQFNRPYEELTKAQQETLELNRKKQEVEEMKPVQVGQDDYGRPIMAKRNRETGEYEIIKPNGAPTPDQPVAPGASGAAPPAPTQTNATGDSTLPANATPTEGFLATGAFPGDTGAVATTPPPPGVNVDALSGMKPADAATVRAIAEGRQRFLPLTRNNPYNRYIMEKVHEYDPGADEAAFSRRSRTQNFFAVGTQGGGGQNIAAMNTFGQHADELLRLSEELNLGRFKDWNAAKVWMAKHGYSSKEVQDKLGAWEVAQKAVADEGAKVFAGTNSALADRSAWEEKFSADNPASVTRTKLKETVKLIEGRLNSLAGQYNDGMRTGHQPAEFIKPRTREIFDRINGKSPTAPAGGGGKPDPQARFQELLGSGLTKEQAYAKMHQEGY